MIFIIVYVFGLLYASIKGRIFVSTKFLDTYFIAKKESNKKLHFVRSLTRK